MKDPGPSPAGRRTVQQRSGDAAEAFVAARLLAAGWRLLGRNVRIGRLELDLVAVDPGPPEVLVVVEVRWRRSRSFGLPEETFDHRKRGHLRAAVGRLIESGGLPAGSPLPHLPVRLDLVVVEPADRPGGDRRVRHHRSALSA